jgi:hypothetical protein
MITSAARRLSPAATQLRLIMTDDNETSETLAPDTDRATRDTTPPDPVAEAGALKALATMLPAAPLASPAPAPPEYWKAAYDKLVEIHEDSKKDRDTRQAREDALVGRFVAAAKESSDANRDNLITALGEVAKSVEDIGAKLVVLEETAKAKDAAQDKRLAEGDARFLQIERSVAELRTRFDALVTELAQAKANAARPPEAPSSAQP